MGQTRWVAGVGAVGLLVGACGGGGDKPVTRPVAAAIATTTSSTSTSVSAVPSTSTTAAPATTSTTTRPVVRTTTTTKPTPTTARPATTTTAPPPSTSTTSTTVAASGSAIHISGYRFDPPVLQVAAGTRVTVDNQDGTTHTWTANNGEWDSGQLAQGARYSFTFSTPGTYAYHCAIHASMTGTVSVS